MEERERRVLNSLVLDATDPKRTEGEHGKELQEKARKAIADVARQSDLHLKSAFQAIWKQLRTKNSQTRLHALGVLGSLARKSTRFRALLFPNLGELLRLCVVPPGFEDELPEPHEAASALVHKATTLLRGWAAVHGAKHAQLQVASEYVARLVGTTPQQEAAQQERWEQDLVQQQYRELVEGLPKFSKRVAHLISQVERFAQLLHLGEELDGQGEQQPPMDPLRSDEEMIAELGLGHFGYTLEIDFSPDDVSVKVTPDNQFMLEALHDVRKELGRSVTRELHDQLRVANAVPLEKGEDETRRRNVLGSIMDCQASVMAAIARSDLLLRDYLHQKSGTGVFGGDRLEGGEGEESENSDEWESDEDSGPAPADDQGDGEQPADALSSAVVKSNSHLLPQLREEERKAVGKARAKAGARKGKGEGSSRGAKRKQPDSRQKRVTRLLKTKLL